MITNPNTEMNNEQQTKESWSKPEFTIIGINEETLGVTGSGSDNATYS